MRQFLPLSWVLSLLLLLGMGSNALAERIAPITRQELLDAPAIALGHFSAKDNRLQFIPARILKGDLSESQLQPALSSMQIKPDGQILTTVPSYNSLLNFSNVTAIDARREMLWFFSAKSSRSLLAEPAELAEGFQALLAKKNPPLTFRLLQCFDPVMQRDALEELFAHPHPAVVAQLHAIVLNSDSDLTCGAAETLTRTRLLDPAKLWGKWPSLACASVISDTLLRRDRPRAIADIQAALAAEKNPVRRESIFYLLPYDSSERLECAVSFLDNPAPSLRERAVTTLWNQLWSLNVAALTSPQARDQLAALGKRLVPILDARLKVETDPTTRARLGKMLAREHNIPWILRIPRDTLSEPIAPYSEDAEFQFLIYCLTSRNQEGFISRTAGEELAERFLPKALDQLKADGRGPNFNADIVYDGMGYVRDQRVFDFLVEHVRKTSIGDPTFRAALRSIGRQDNKQSLAVLKETIAGRVHDKYEWEDISAGALDGLAALSDKDTLAYLQQLQPRIQYPSYDIIRDDRARAFQGDPEAIASLFVAADHVPEFNSRDEVFAALCEFDQPKVTAALKKYVEQSWPSGASPRPISANLENFAGDSHRTSPLAEIARRDPQWLAALALRQMASPSLDARAFAADVFRKLTAMIGDYNPEAFASERTLPLKKIQAWWSQHKSQTREQWLLACFKQKGFEMQHLDRDALPVLSRALESDFFTSNLALEQISAMCQKYFCDFPNQESYQGQERMTVRVRGWLQARHYLSP